jgi:hypothetical protein
MIVCAGGDDQKVTMTTVTDFANVVAMAVEYPGDWPVVGGMKGSDLSLRDLLTLGEQLRGTSTPIGRISRDQTTCALILSRRTFRSQQSQRRPAAPGRLRKSMASKGTAFFDSARGSRTRFEKCYSRSAFCNRRRSLSVKRRLERSIARLQV